MTPNAAPSHTNRLAQESSPYLLQHQHNPVDWYAWGPEAIERARREDKPIFLSVGYSTCYWCHVMERQCFENPKIAELMNEHFVNIKVDREERPDVDQVYMTAVQILTRHGGWPMSVWMTPDLRPFYAGTYFPPADMQGRPGFPTVLLAIADAYRNRRTDIEKTAGELVDVLQQLAEPRSPRQAMTIDARTIGTWLTRSTDDYEPRYGGFGAAPKFPRQTLLELLLRHQRRSPDEQRLGMLRHALDAMAAGGIRDHLGGAFHRYSTDARWLVPHFEIMLYDNGMLAWCYAEAFAQMGEARYAEVARGICDFILAEMTSPDGAFYTALDAEVDAMEGGSYLWTPGEVAAVLGKDDAGLFNRVYGLDRGFNFADPHHGSGEPDKNVLFLPQPIEAAAGQLGLDIDELESRLADMRARLYAARRERKQPLLDTKIITSWNALMIRGMAHVGAVLAEGRYVSAAEKAALFLVQHHMDAATGQLWRTSRGGRRQHAGFVEDYAFFADACLVLDAAGASRGGWRLHAQEMLAQIHDRFGSGDSATSGAGADTPTDHGLYFNALGAGDVIVRQKIATDSPLPSGNAVAARVMLELGHRDSARSIIEAFAQPLEDHAEGMSAMIDAAAEYVARHGPIEAAPSTGAADPAVPPQKLARAVVSLSAEWSSPREIRVRVEVIDGFHINAHEVAPPLLSTHLLVTPAQGASVSYPPGASRAVAAAGEAARVYEGSIELVVMLDAPPAVPVKLTLAYQACTSDVCLPPATKTITLAPQP